ncbi:MAG TPA: LacI family DNA-binding transcriptional regulator [Capsulimonadaceae bacterium]|nr:LacI family DNA-binding transcriptional regulator [Capsulimonadaceae bacterium]
MPITLKDIADRTGVSPSVVSTVLSGRDNGTFVSKETRERVLQVARALNYTPVRSGRPRGSRRLRRQRVEQFIGVWIPENDPSAMHMLQALQGALTKYAAEHAPSQGEEFDYGFRLLAEDDLPRLDMLGVMGLIVLGDIALPRTAAAATTPTVLIGEVDQLPREVVTVHLDNFTAGREIGSHLWDLGHRRVAFVAPNYKPRVTRQRWQGIQSVWVDHAAPADSCLPAPYDLLADGSLSEQVSKAVSALFAPGSAESNRPTAIACFNEHVASYTLRTLQSLGLRVPQDISLVAFGDTPFGAEAMAPALTTIRPPVGQLATTAIAQLYSLHREADQERPALAADQRRDIVFAGELVVRASSQAVD